MPVEYRNAQAADLVRAQQLVASSINNLTERHGFGPMASVRPPLFQMFALQNNPDGLWVAEEVADIVGFAFSWVCGDLWFLAELFVSPTHQGHGIGNELLKRTLQQAQKTGAANKALITFTFNTVSQGLYIRHGLLPRTPVYNFSVARDVLLARLRGAPLRCAPLEDTPRHLHALAQIDAVALGVSRGQHHKFLLSDSAIRGVMVYDGDDCLGYAYVNSGGHVGPLAVARRDAVGAVFRTALNLAADSGASQVSAFLPGTCDAALSTAVEHGMRITLPMLLMSTREFGDWTQYLPRNPGFM